MSGQFGAMLKGWRMQRRMSQLDLATEAGVSSRHISFLETGRSRPSRGMVLRLCERLEIPRASRNQLLMNAGMAPAYSERSMSEDEMRPVRDAMGWMMQQHAPFPAIALDRHWIIKELNTPAALLFSLVNIKSGDSMITALAENHILRTGLENLEEVLRYSIARLRTENAHLGNDPVLTAGIRELEQSLPVAAKPSGVMPAFIPARYRLGDKVLSFLSTITQFGTVEDIALSDMRIEMMYPADDITRNVLEALAKDGLNGL